MIRLEISDLLLLDKSVLKETGLYLIALSGAEPEPTPEPAEQEPELTTEPAEQEPEPTPEPAEVFKVQTPSELGCVEIDKENLPWDGRIHARTKTKDPLGYWKKKKGVFAADVARVKAELKAAQNIPPLPPIPDASQFDKVPDFADLMDFVTSAITAGTLQREQVTETLAPFGIPALPVVATRLDLIPHVLAALKEVVNATL